MFHSQGQATQHMNALGHWAPKIPCETCGWKFHTVASAEKHMQAQKHYKSYCPDCGVQFQNENNLKMVSFPFPWAALVPNEFHKQHLNSKIHRDSQIVTRKFFVLSVRASSPLAAAWLITWSGVLALRQRVLTARPSSTLSVNMIGVVSSPINRSNGIKTTTPNTPLQIRHSMATIGSATYATRNSRSNLI